MQTGTREIHIFRRTRCIQPVKEIGQFLRVLGLDSFLEAIKEKSLKSFVRKAFDHYLMCDFLGYACQGRQAKITFRSAIVYLFALREERRTRNDF